MSQTTMPVGRLQGIEKPISRLVQGSMMLNEADSTGGFALLDAALQAGINTFDNAHVYNGGQCERVLGAWMKARGNREQAVVVTKGCHPYGAGPRVTPEAMQSDLRDSLERLQTDYVDLWLFHRDDPEKPVGPLVEQAHRFVLEGKVKAYGGSNWEVARIEAARAYAEEHGLTPMVASSPNFSLADQVEPPWGDCTTLSGPKHAEARRWHEQTGVAVFAWSSLASGFLSGRLNRQNFQAQKQNFPEHCTRAYASEANFKRLDRLAELAAKKGSTVPQLALAYVANQNFNAFPVAAAMNAAEVAANVQAVRLKLSPDELAYLDLRA